MHSHVRSSASAGSGSAHNNVHRPLISQQDHQNLSDHRTAAISEINDSDAVPHRDLSRRQDAACPRLSTVLQFATDELTAYGTSIANALYKTGDVKETIEGRRNRVAAVGRKRPSARHRRAVRRAPMRTRPIFTPCYGRIGIWSVPANPDSSGTPTTRGECCRRLRGKQAPTAAGSPNGCRLGGTISPT